jgi:hypothetical protein
MCKLVAGLVVSGFLHIVMVTICCTYYMLYEIEYISWIMLDDIALTCSCWHYSIHINYNLQIYILLFFHHIISFCFL